MTHLKSKYQKISTVQYPSLIIKVLTRNASKLYENKKQKTGVLQGTSSEITVLQDTAHGRLDHK